MSEQFLSMHGVKVGAEYLRRITNEPHTACVIDVNNVSARSYSEYVYKYKAPSKKLPKFMIGNAEKRMREQNKIQVKNEKGNENKIRTRKTETIKIKTKNTAAVGKKKKGKSVCNQLNKRGISIRTAADIDYSRRSINCDAGYNI